MFIISLILVFLCSFAYFGRHWLINNVGLISIDEVIFHLKVPLAGTSSETASSLILNLLVYPLLCTAVFGVLLFFIRADVPLKFRGKEYTISLKKLLPRLVTIVGAIALFVQLVWLNNDYHVTDYIAAQSENSTFVEEQYVDPRNVELTFPEKKRNLIYIYLESTETTYASKKNGGLQGKSIMPELEELALKNTSFSNSEKLGGARHTFGTGWTMAGIVAQTAGIPLKTSVTDYNEYLSQADHFMPGIYTLGDILKDNGYSQVFMAGSDMTFGGRRTYLKEHGNYEIRDLLTAKESGRIPEDYFVFWGMEDSKLFDYAKDEITELAKKDAPFNFSMLTVNTHFGDGYLEGSCPKPYDDQYTNVILCSSRQISDFVSWIKSQDFYKNSTVILSGDHPTMATNPILGNDEDGYDRTIYNVFINSAIKDPKHDIIKNRTFTTLDFFPTTLSAIGVKIPNDRLGLGTDLYSGKQTLAEEFGLGPLHDELSRRSEYYTNKFF